MYLLNVLVTFQVPFKLSTILFTSQLLALNENEIWKINVTMNNAIKTSTAQQCHTNGHRPTAIRGPREFGENET